VVAKEEYNVVAKGEWLHKRMVAERELTVVCFLNHTMVVLFKSIGK